MTLYTMTIKQTPEEQAAMQADYDARRAAEANAQAARHTARVALLKEIGQGGATLFGWVGPTVDASQREHASLRFATRDGVAVMLSLWMGTASKIEVYIDSLKSPDGSITIAHHHQTSIRRAPINVSPDRSALAICKDIQRRFINSDEFAGDAIEMRKLLDARISGRSNLKAAMAQAALLGYKPDPNTKEDEANSVRMNAPGKRDILVTASGQFRFTYTANFDLDALDAVLAALA